MLTNISKEIRILESEEISRPVKPQEEEKKEKPRDGYVPCKTCKSTLHNPRQCRVGTPEERKKYYVDNKKCLKCLFGMHPTETCKQTRNCSICNSPGHSMAVCTKKPNKPSTSVTHKYIITKQKAMKDMEQGSCLHLQRTSNRTMGH